MAASKATALRGEMLYGEPLSRYTTWCVGGPADRFYRPADAEDLVTFLQTINPAEPLLWLGLGSNLLVRDGGFRGTVVATQRCLDAITISGETLRAEAGASCARVSRFAARNRLCGAEFLAGIPGTIGGALAMNAGAFGGEIWRCVEQVETLDRQGRVRARKPTEFEIGYRHVSGVSGEWFLAASLQLQSGDVEQGQAKIRELLARRAETQPTGQKSCGSVFKNPQGDHAARLIEAAGLKGASIGDAAVSEKHANFIINTGAASAVDIEGLIRQVHDEVQRRFAVDLQTEVRIVGEERI